jgi:ATP-dependent DNA helicase Rep
MPRLTPDDYEALGDAIVRKSGLEAEIRQKNDDGAARDRKLINLRSLPKWLATVAAGRLEENGHLSDDAILDVLALDNERPDEKKDGGNHVSLMSVHAAKGLEFPHVFVVGCEEGLLPHARVLTERATDIPMADGAVSLEEERRLFYVAVTRAQDRLWLTRSEKRAFRGKLASRVPSRFLVEIPEDLLVMRQDAPPPSLGMDALAAAADNLLAAVTSAGAGGDPFANPPPMRRRP